MAEHKKSVVVTGSSGFIGKRLVSRLSKFGYSVVSMYHHRLPEPMANVYPVCTDFLSSENLIAPIRGVETVVHLAWSTGSGQGKLQKQELAAGENLRISKNLIAACEISDVKRIVFLSALGAHSEIEDPFLKEKYEVERTLLQSKIPEKVILRCSVVCSDDGMNDPFLWSILKLMQFPMVYPVPAFRERIAPVFIDDLVKTIEKSIQSPMKQSFDLREVQGPVSYAVGELFKLVQERYVKGRRLALTGAIGEKLLPLFEVDSRRRVQMGRNRQKLERKNIKSYLTLSHPSAAQPLLQDSAETEKSKDKYLSFADVLKHGRSKPESSKGSPQKAKT